MVEKNKKKKDAKNKEICGQSIQEQDIKAMIKNTTEIEIKNKKKNFTKKILDFFQKTWYNYNRK